MADRLVVLTMMGMTPEDIEATIRDQLARTGARVIFTDLPAGSATIAARRIVKDDPGLVLVSSGYPRNGGMTGNVLLAFRAAD